MRIIRTSDRKSLAALRTRDAARDVAVERQASRIVTDVRERGDAALREWTKKLDGHTNLKPLSHKAMEAGWRETPKAVRRALRVAIDNLAKVAAHQVPRPFSITVSAGHRIEQRVQPLQRVGCYVPGGRYPLPSTLVMTAVPAKVAGVKEIVVVCPKPAAVVLAAAVEVGVTDVFAIGGAQAVGALAYGTKSLPRVDKIVGPGNAWVAAAKALVARDCPIDVHAGPSEIVVYSNRGRADWIAADLIAQAEHDPAARAIFVTTKAALATEVAMAVAAAMPATGPASRAIADSGAIIIASGAREARQTVNDLAPEHLVIDDDDDASTYRTAGTVFVGEWSVQAAGDYCTGSNHVLPTGGAGRFRGGLSASDFVRVFSVQSLSRAAIRRLGPSAVTLAEAEGLSAHAASIKARL